MFDFFKRKNKQEETEVTTLEQVRKAYADLSEDDKKSFHQSIADRAHESIAAQERADGNEDSQSAADREHEALGEEHAEGHGDVDELHMEGDHRDTEKEESDHDNFKTEMRAFMKNMSRYFESLEKRAEAAANPDSEAAKRMEETYGIGNGVFQGDDRSVPEKRMTKEDIAKTISKFM